MYKVTNACVFYGVWRYVRLWDHTAVEANLEGCILGNKRDCQTGMSWGEGPGEASKKGREEKPDLGLSGFTRETGIKIPILLLSQRLNEDFIRQC